jgi:succinate dehydrogenase hydrophobic anchor subunit
MKSTTSDMEKQNNNWNLAILTFVILILLFFWYYNFLFITDPTKLSTPIQLNFINK